MKIVYLIKKFSFFSEFFFFLFFSFIYTMNRFVLRILSRPNTILKHFSTTHDHRLNTSYWIESVANECFSRTRKTLLIFVLIQTYGSTKKKKYFVFVVILSFISLIIVHEYPTVWPVCSVFQYNNDLHIYRRILNYKCKWHAIVFWRYDALRLYYY